MKTKILIVDDDVLVTNMLREYLELEGHETEAAFDGVAAIKLAASYKPDLIVMDITMPLLNGLGALVSIRKTPEIQNTPIIFITGLDPRNLDSIKDHRQHVAYIRKPIDLDSLSILIQLILPKQVQPSAPVQEFDSQSSYESYPAVVPYNLERFPAR